MLNPDSPLPLYRQLADALRAKIRAGDYPEGTRIPSEHALAADFGIGRPTVRQATDLLVRQRLLERRRGSGTFVCGPPRELDLFSISGTSAAFLEQGIEPEVRYLERLALRRAPAPVSDLFGKPRAYSLSRIYAVACEPVLSEQIWLHPAVFEGIERFDLHGESLARLAREHFYLRPKALQQSFEVREIESALASALGLAAGAWVLRVRRRLEFASAGTALFAVLDCRTDRFAFAQTLGASQLIGGPAFERDRPSDTLPLANGRHA